MRQENNMSESDHKHSSNEEFDNLQAQLEEEKQRSKNLENKLSERAFQLKEREKELTGIYRITQLINDPNNTIDSVLEEAAVILSESYLYPEKACAKITWDGKAFTTKNFKKTEWEQSVYQELEQAQGSLSISVFYTEELPVLDEGPFLRNERELLETIAKELAVYLHRNQAEINTELKEQEFESVFNSVLDAIFIHDLEGNFVEVNNEACRRLNYSRDEIRSMTPMDLDEKSYAEKAPRIFKKLDKNGHYKGETIHVTKDGIKINTELNSTKISYKGKPAILTVARDITDRKQYEDELLTAKKKAEESDRLKSSFLANLSHEIRTPLNAILGFAGLLNMENLKESEKKDFIVMIKEAGNKLLNIINDIMDISFIESGQIKLDKQEFSLNAMIDNLQEEIRSKMDTSNKNIEITTYKHFEDGEDFFVSDHDKVHQIYSKLLDNALKFTKTGYIEFGYTYNEEDYIEFYVEDTGIGISEEIKSTIFERFRQGDYGMERQYEGLGLGLSIARGLVEQLGGSIEINSQVNTGATITFRLPYQASKKPSPDREKSVPTTDISGKKILIAEDDLSNFLLLRQLLNDTNTEIIHAENGAEAVECCKESDEIGLILMDIKMPVMDGIEALSKIRKINPGIPVIALTAYAYENDKKRLLDKGFDQYLSKPIDKNDLIKVIDETHKSEYD
ncbi:MAG: PAS domain-containing hybrid sensor histidine kinase/response regulator [Bacteroidota bacterium]